MITESSRSALAGVLLFAMLCCAVLDGTGEAALGGVGGLCAWAAAVLLWRELAIGPRRQCLALIGAGAAAMAWVIATGGAVDPVRVLNENLSLLAMLAGVSFIRLASVASRNPAREAPSGPRALLSTLLGVNVLGAATNITALVLVADRVARNGKLNPFEASALARAFALSVLYSPFIGGMAFAFNRAPDANLAHVATYGVVLTIALILCTWVPAARSGTPRVADFQGYPLHVEALWFPALLAAGVLVVHFFFPDVPVLTVIAALAPVSACLVLLGRVGFEPAMVRAVEHVSIALTQMVGELWLFLSAGVLAVGISSVLAISDASLPIASVGGLTASGAMIIVLLVSAAGLHPVVSLSALIPLLQPFDPSPQLIVLLCVCSWSAGSVLCPYSGVNLVLQGRFQLDAWSLARRSWGYGLVIWCASTVAFIAVGGF